MHEIVSSWKGVEGETGEVWGRSHLSDLDLDRISRTFQKPPWTGSENWRKFITQSATQM